MAKSDRELQRRAQDLALAFSKEEFKVIRDEMQDMKLDLLVTLCAVDLSTELGRDRAAKVQGQIQFIDLWTTMPERTSKLIEMTRSFATGIGDFFTARKS